MATEPQLFFQKQPFGVRLTQDEINFVNENYDDLFDGDENIQPRKAFILLCEKSLATVKRNKESLPKDLERIEELMSQNIQVANELKELKAKHSELSAQFNETVEIKLRLEKQVQELTELNAQLQEELTRIPVTSDKPVEYVPATTERLLKLTPLESFILAEIEKQHACDAKEILINRFFMVYQRRGNGDYNIKRFTESALRRTEAHFNS